MKEGIAALMPLESRYTANQEVKEEGPSPRNIKEPIRALQVTKI
jgi:hypothetical protein